MAGIASDHECTTYEEALEKRRLGMWIMIREGSAARNLEALLPLVEEFGPGNCLLCTDDREPDQLLAEGHINHVMRKAVSLGCKPYWAVVMATMFAARYHRLHEHGAVLVWETNEAGLRSRDRLLSKFPGAHIQPRLALPWRNGAPLPPVPVGWALLPPQR